MHVPGSGQQVKLRMARERGESRGGKGREGECEDGQRKMDREKEEEKEGRSKGN